MNENQNTGDNQKTAQGDSVLQFKVSCPRCRVVFFLPVELGGEMAECSECGEVFKIPVYDEKENFEVTETGTIRAVPSDLEEEEARRTVRLSRTNIGMRPALKENFEIGTKNLPPGDKV